MKKILFMALVVLAGATVSANAADKKNKKNKKQEVVQEECCGKCNAPVVLTTSQDSVSYAAGMAVTQGLLDFLQKNYDLDTMYMADFKKGFYEAIARGTDPKYVAYNAGLQIATQVQKQILPRQMEAFADTPDSINADIFYRGFMDGATSSTEIMTAQNAMTYARDKQEAIKKQKEAAYIAENTKWLEENKTKAGVVTLPSGLQYKVITQGFGTVATKDDNVTVKYEGKMIDGTVFDSSYKRNPDTTSFRPDQVIKGWTEALCMMPEGSKWELYIPQELAYGERPAGKIKPYSTLIFTVEIVKVEKKAEEEVKAEPAPAKPVVKKTPAKKTVKK